MVGDQADITARIRATLPIGWFGDDSPLLNSLLTGLSNAWAWIHGQIEFVRRQGRVVTATDIRLDLIANDYFGPDIARRRGELDERFRTRICAALLRNRGTRRDVVSTLTDLTGRAPKIFEPARPLDTGGYGVDPATSGGLAYNMAGGWGNLSLPFQFFITAYRPLPMGISFMPGWGCSSAAYGGGLLQYGNLDLMSDKVTDYDIYHAVSAVLPVATTGWMQITE